MDYWKEIDLHVYVNWQEFLEKNPGARLVMASTKGRIVYSDFQFKEDDYLVFGKESAGIPEEILKEYPDTTVRIPMLPDIRSLNLSNSAAVVLYEALRQTGFAGMQTKGELHRLRWDQE